MEYKFEFLSQSFVPSMVSIAFFEVKKAVSAVCLFQSAIILCSVLPRHFKLAFPISSIGVEGAYAISYMNNILHESRLDKDQLSGTRQREDRTICERPAWVKTKRNEKAAAEVYYLIR
jgi:hypothetical protein